MTASGRGIDWLVGRWNAFWFTPARPTNLGVSRMVMFALLLWVYWSKDPGQWADVPPIFWMPIPLFRVLHLPVLPELVLNVLHLAWLAFLLLSCIGLWTRISTKAAFILGVYLIGLPQNFGKTHHGDTLAVLALGIMAFAHAGDAWSVDRLIRVVRGGNAASVGDRPSAEYTWPLRLVLVMFCLVFFGAGISKVRRSGLEWVTSDNMQNTLIADMYDHEPPTSLGLTLAQHPLLTRIQAGASLALELGVIFAIFSARLRLPLILGLGGMQFGIWLLMGVSFVPYLSVYPVLLPWDKIGEWLGGHTSSSGRMTMLYDGGCGICTSTMRLIKTLDLRNALAFMDVARDWPTVSQRFPRLEQAECLRDMHVVLADGGTVTGYEAYRRMAWGVPLAWPLLPLFYLPGVPLVGRRIYSKVADGRMRDGCELPTGRSG